MYGGSLCEDILLGAVYLQQNTKKKLVQLYFSLNVVFIGFVTLQSIVVADPWLIRTLNPLESSRDARCTSQRNTRQIGEFSLFIIRVYYCIIAFIETINPSSVISVLNYKISFRIFQHLPLDECGDYLCLVKTPKNLVIKNGEKRA